jgi:uncharacterized membrane protein YeaQ/YmgE (transglycosylase-associated protein family)
MIVIGFDLATLIAMLIVGGIAGWLAGTVMKVKGTLLMYIIVGVLGGLLGPVLFRVLGIYAPVTGRIDLVSIISSFVGAVVLLWLYKLFSR